MEEQLRSLLLSISPVTAIVGTRIDWGARPQGGALPALVLSVIDDNGGHTLDGPHGLFAARVQIDCYGASYGAAKLLSRSVRSALDGYRGGIFQAVLLAGARDGREGGTNEADRPFRVSLDFMVHYSTS